MKPFRRSALVLVGLGVAGCGSDATGSPDTVAIERPDGVVSSVDQLSSGYWQPIRVDDADIDRSEGDAWQFGLREGEFQVTGFDGCNGFGTQISEPDGPPRLLDGRMLDVVIDMEAMGCDAVTYGPYPEEGDLLRFAEGGSVLQVVDDDGVRVELINVDVRPPRDFGVDDDATQVTTPDTDPDPADTTTTSTSTTTVPPADNEPAALADLVGADFEPVLWRPVVFDGEAVAAESRQRWQFSDQPDGFFVSGFDGCNNFSNTFDSDSTVRPSLVGGVLTDLEMSFEEVACDDVVPGPTPQEGDLLRLVDDGSRLEIVRGGEVVIELTRDG